MKRELLNYFIQNKDKLKQGVSPSLKKKIFIGLGVLAVFFFVSLGLLAYVGVKVSSYVITQATQILTPTTQPNVSAQNSESWSEETTAPTTLPSVNSLSLNTIVQSACYREITGLLSLNLWLNTPIAKIFNQITTSCLQLETLKNKQVEPRPKETI